jgi:hypothetical protein
LGVTCGHRARLEALSHSTTTDSSTIPRCSAPKPYLHTYLLTTYLRPPGSAGSIRSRRCQPQCLWRSRLRLRLRMRMQRLHRRHAQPSRGAARRRGALQPSIPPVAQAAAAAAAAVASAAPAAVVTRRHRFRCPSSRPLAMTRPQRRRHAQLVAQPRQGWALA